MKEELDVGRTFHDKLGKPSKTLCPCVHVENGIRAHYVMVFKIQWKPPSTGSSTPTPVPAAISTKRHVHGLGGKNVNDDAQIETRPVR